MRPVLVIFRHYDLLKLSALQKTSFPRNLSIKSGKQTKICATCSSFDASYCRYYATKNAKKIYIFFMIFHEFRWADSSFFSLAFFYKVGKFLRAEKRNVSAKEGMQLTKKSRLQIFDCKNGSASFDLERTRRSSSCSKCDYSTSEN